MTLLHILVFASIALLHGAVFKSRGRAWLLLAVSVLAVYWLQPSTPIRNLDYWLPTASLALAIFTWAATCPAPRIAKQDWITLSVVLGLALLVALNRYIDYCCLIPSRPPDVVRVLIAIAIVIAITSLVARNSPNNLLPLTLIIFFLVLFISLKAEPLAQVLSTGLRSINAQNTAEASALDIRWLGFSYLAFRLIHTLRERTLGKLPDLSLQEFLIYAVFFPAFTSGPIDRVERFVKDLRAPFALTSQATLAGGWRLLWGIFKKFALADTLSLIALNGLNAAQVTTSGWLWALLYAYAFRIYFDFSGYTDIALGLGHLLGVRLPENFDRPYLKQNLTAFWNSWHITLAQWFRAYYFNPVTRALRSRSLSPVLVIAFTQFTTMLLIGLWHGLTWNFVAWGAWHGLGLFVHNRWADFTRPRAALLDGRPWLKRAAAWGGVLLTFNYVVLGWVWFALSDIGLAAQVMRKLFGL